MNLFKKAIVFGDIHFGLRSNSETHNKDCINFVKWMISEAKKEGCETCLFLGDYHHNRASLNLQTLSYSLKALELLSENFEQTYVITGNHDLYHRNNRSIHSVEWAKHLPNLTIVNDWFTKGDVAIVPWLVEDDYKEVSKLKAKYMFGHFELPHFQMNALVEMPDTGELNSDQLGNVEHVYSGHFHMRQTRKNVTYVGNCFPHNFADSGDEKRGVMILEWGEEHKFKAWPEQPLYLVTDLSKLINNADDILKPNMYVKINLDIEISYEEANFLKETFLEQYNLREVSLVPSKTDDHQEDVSTSISFSSIDSIISEQITNIESDKYQSELLMKIYNDL